MVFGHIQIPLNEWGLYFSGLCHILLLFNDSIRLVYHLGDFIRG